MAEKELTTKQKLFVIEYCKTFNATQAYKKVYGCDDDTANANGARLLANDSIQEAVQKKKDKILEKADVTIEQIVKELKSIAFMNFNDIIDKLNKKIPLTEEEQKSIAGKDIVKTKDGYSLRYKAWDKIKALELLGRYKVMFTDKIKNENHDFKKEDMTPEEEDAEIKRLLKIREEREQKS